MASDLDTRPDGCIFRTTTALASGFAMGGIAGAMAATWADVPKVLKGRAVPALMATGRVMGAYGVTMGAVGGVYAATDCLAESMRGRKDAYNGVLGGVAAGAVLGLRVGKLPIGVGAAVALAGMSAIVDTTGQQLRGSGGFDDGATPARLRYPREAKA